MLEVKPQKSQKKTGSKISDIAYNNILSDISPQARETKEKINKWDYIKLKSFFTAKENSNKIKRQPTEWEKIFANTSDTGLNPKFITNLQNSTPKKTQLN